MCIVFVHNDSGAFATRSRHYKIEKFSSPCCIHSFVFGFFSEFMPSQCGLAVKSASLTGGKQK